MNNTKKHIIFIVSGGDGFPFQGAYSNRIISMAKGLAQSGTSAVELRFVFLGSYNLDTQTGFYEGIPYRYCLNPLIKLTGVTKPWLHLTGMLLAAVDLLLLKKIQNLVIIACVHSLLSNPLWVICKLRGVPVVRELNEFPLAIISKGMDKLGFWDKFKIRSTLSEFSGFIAISNGLANYLTSQFPGKPVLILPINVQPERFAQPIQTEKKYITYAGVLSNYKDGLSYLIDAFAKVSHINTSLILRLVGGFSTTADKADIESQIQKLDLGGRIEFTGMLNRFEAARCILEAYILVLPRPDNVQAQGGFPTKLGEYLATGIPVVATAVGDIPHYLKNGENAFLAKPGSVDDLLDSLLSILKEYQAAVLVAEKGKLLALDVFDYRKQAYKISGFLDQFLNQG